MSRKLDSIEPLRSLLDQLAGSLADVFESMAEQKPEIQWQPASGPASSLPSDPSAVILWWEQPLQFAPEMKIWVGAPQSVWEYAGSLVLKAAGLDSVEAGEAKNTWIEVLGQSLSAVARAAGGTLGREVSCETGAEAAPPEANEEWASLSIVFPDRPLEAVFVAFSPQLIEVLCAPAPSHESAAPETESPPSSPLAALGERSRTLDLLLDVDLPVSISFGKTQLALKDVIKLTTGSIVELNRGVNEPVEVLVNQTLVARGEVVVVDGNYGVRILEIATRSERLRSLQ
jgi:flagellar motor switch protein FliN/FliY